MATYLEVCEHAARAGGHVLYSMIGNVEVREKGKADLVTEADLQAQSIIQEAIAKEFPDHGFIGEETGLPKPGDRPTGLFWAVDPLDGTTNFVHHVPHFATSVALVENGEPVVAAVFNPMTEECYTAEVGKGAYLNGIPILCSGETDPSQALAVVGFPPVVDEETPDLKLFMAAIDKYQAIRRTGSAALNTCYLAAGRFDAMWNFGVKIWDIAAGVLMIREAGGVVSNWDGGPIDLFSPRLIASATPELHEHLLEYVRAAGIRFD